MSKKEMIEVIDRGGAKTVAKKKSFVTRVKRIFAVITVIWFAFVIWFPLHVKNTYSGPIKKSIVVSMFFDIQRNIVEQYENLLHGIKKSINLEKPIGIAIEKVKLAESKVEKVTDATASAKKTTDSAKKTTASVKNLTGLVGKFGVKTTAVDNVLDKADSGIDKVNTGINKVDDTAKIVNSKLDNIEKELIKISQTEIDKMIDDAIKSQIDKNSGGLGTTLLTNYGIKHVYPWRPSSWPVAVKIYNGLSQSNVGVIQILTRTVDKYFGYVAWGLVFAAWIAGFYLWSMTLGKVKAIIAPFLVCPRCGHTYADKRTAMGLLKVFQPWQWFM